MDPMHQPVLYVIACGGPRAGDLPAFVRFAQAEGWDACVIATPDGAKFIDMTRLAQLTGHPVRVHYKQPDEPDVLRTQTTANRLARPEAASCRRYLAQASDRMMVVHFRNVVMMD